MPGKTAITGLPIKDAKKVLRLEVTRRDIVEAKRKNHGACAAANACIRQLKCKDVKIHIGRVYIKNGKHWTRYQTPPSLRTEITAFDRGGTFEPSVHVLTPVRIRPKRRLKKESGPAGNKIPNAARRRAAHIVAGVRSHA